MHRVPLSTPAHAAALVAVGFPHQGVKLDPLHHTGTGERNMGWYYEGSNAPDAADLLRRRGPDLQNALWRSDAAHPFLAALAGAGNLEALEAWRKAPASIPAGRLEKGGKLLLLFPPDRQPGVDPHGIYHEQLVPHGAVAVDDADLAAALVAVGFAPAPRLYVTGAFLISKSSFLYPDLTMERAVDAAALMHDPEQLLPVQLENFKPGQHPFQFAYAAAGNYLSVPESERLAWRQTTHFIKGKRTALANAEALRNPTLEEKIMRHVAGL